MQADGSAKQEMIRYLESVIGGKIRRRSIRAIRVKAPVGYRSSLLIEVGKSYRNLEPDAPVEEVIAVFESDSFLVCTETRGACRGLPYYFARGDVTRVFEE
jgi:hypothetical protein